jgi:hypothetical protein
MGEIEPGRLPEEANVANGADAYISGFLQARRGMPLLLHIVPWPSIGQCRPIPFD